MNTQWYCKNCGITEDAETNLPCGVVVCRACCHSVEKSIPPHVTAMVKQISALQTEKEVKGGRAALQAENAKLRKVAEDLVALIDDSHGVAGLHLNGDVAPWDELLAGGRFEDWLRSLRDAGYEL